MTPFLYLNAEWVVLNPDRLIHMKEIYVLMRQKHTQYVQVVLRNLRYVFATSEPI